MSIKYSTIKNQQNLSSIFDVTTNKLISSVLPDTINNVISNNKIVNTALPVVAMFNELSISNINYDENGNPSTVTYSTGNKQVINYNATTGNVDSIVYYDTNGTTVLSTQTFTYDANGNLVSSAWT